MKKKNLLLVMFFCNMFLLQGTYADIAVTNDCSEVKTFYLTVFGDSNSDCTAPSTLELHPKKTGRFYIDKRKDPDDVCGYTVEDSTQPSLEGCHDLFDGLNVRFSEEGVWFFKNCNCQKI